MSDIRVVVPAPPPINVTVNPLGATGPSAYQLAVAKGYPGTEDEWLADQKGEDGAPGPTAVSADAGNTATLGEDGLIYVPESTSGGGGAWGEITGTLSEQTDLQDALDLKADAADLGSAASAETADFASAAQGGLADSAVQPGDLGTAASADSSAFATAAQGAKADTAVQPADLTAAIEDVVDSAPGALDTLNELAAALGDDANFAANVTASLAGKANTADLGTAATRNVPASGNASASEVVKGDDTRLSDARTPTAHTHSASQVTDLASAAATYAAVNAQTATTYSAVLTDVGKLVTLTNAAAIAVTLPKDATAAVPTGARIDFLVLGAGKATFQAESGATVNGTPTLVSRAQYSAVTAVKVASNTWILVGDLG
ncbi:hypothetical protein [Microbacterium jejuense]|uniref:hypothetical protein n=1 Tax=Microbacterium jejuense TaxID=1263637 RepID=UPI0031EDC875